MDTRKNIAYCRKGFTLVELMIAMLISAIIVAAVLTTYKYNRDVYEAQDQVTEIQQTLRAATNQLVREIRMAGFNPQETQDEDQRPKIKEAKKDLLYFTIDLNEDGDVNVGNDDTGEHIVYDLYISPTGTSTLGRTIADNDINLADPLAHQPVADHIQAIEFCYRLKDMDDTDPCVLPAASLSSADIDAVRSIQISILARTRYEDRNYTDGSIYCPASNPYNPATQQCTDPDPAKSWGPYNDHFRRRLLTTNVTCRNLGL
ncbi:MAG: PilW family protein [Desulfobulbaceae bacterium]|nr:PilW family protein [Desulfobulbaceae bacterium]